ncbi:MAG: hypothetical protein ABR521_02475 [Gaiellaceae bacterium]
MSFTAERLIQLLPAVYGLRDGDDGPLHELLDVVADQLAVLEDGLGRLYDDQFVETSAPWVLPYLGDLLGITGLPPSPLTPRAEVAHTIAHRRRKGTAAILEQLARDVTGLPARTVEFFALLCATQLLNHLRPECRSFLPLGDTLRLEELGGPFERLPGRVTLTHTVDVRRIASGRGRYNIPNVGIFLWRLRSQPLTRSPAPPDTPGDMRRFRFSPLGNDAPLFNFPQTEDEPTHLAEPRNVPGRISRRAAAADLPDFYGRSLLIVPPGGPLELDDLVIGDLSDWTSPAGKVAIDPVLGRIVFPDDTEPPLVTFHRGFSANVGGGEYVRSLPEEAVGVAVVAAGSGPGAIQAAIGALPTVGGVVEIADSGRYDETALTIDATGRPVTVRARVGSRPTVVLDGDLTIGGDDAGAVVLDGLLVAGGAVEVQAPPPGETGLGVLELRHTTLVPGISLEPDGDSATADPSLVVRAVTAVTIDRSIVGGVRADRDALVRIVDGILDATAEDGVAFANPDDQDDFGGTLTLEQVTAIGRIKAEALQLVSNSILLAELPGGIDPLEWPGPVVARRRQDGCVRFSYVPPGSRTPRRYRCQPEREADAARVEPILTSFRYADPGYCQLADATSPPIREGADDESELGAFHHLYLPRREAHLRTRLDEQVRFGLEAGVFHVT